MTCVVNTCRVALRGSGQIVLRLYTFDQFAFGYFKQALSTNCCSGIPSHSKLFANLLPDRLDSYTRSDTTYGHQQVANTIVSDRQLTRA